MAKEITKHLNLPSTLVTQDDYYRLYQQSIADPNTFWAEQAQRYLNWSHQGQEILTGDFSNLNVEWFSDWTLNVCENCLDRHLPEKADDIAIIWEGDEPGNSKKITYAQLHEQVCRFANSLKALGVTKGDRVGIYLPMIPEAVVAMLACARIGAVHSVVFAGFSPEALRNRIQDASAKVLITADGNRRGGEVIPLKSRVDDVIDDCPSIEHVVVVQYVDAEIDMHSRDHWFHELQNQASADCPPEIMNATDPLFILYTSGSTGKPKGVLHGQGGYLLYATMSFQLVFNYQAHDIYWCTADIGWITGHSYVVYGPLASGATALIFAGRPTYPTPARFWEIIDEHQVNIFYTAPTALRALMREDSAYISNTRRDSLKLLGSVGEPINPDVWRWYYDVIGQQRCPIVDTWWQTETGGIMISPLPGATPLKPGSASWPFFGVELGIIDEQGREISGEGSGNLVIKKPWPGMLQTVYGDPKRFQSTYFSQYPGAYFAGDGAYRDADGYYWITGRTDDVINVSGHRLDTAEIESVLVEHPDVTEAAVVGMKHPVKGQGIFAYVTTRKCIKPDQALADQLIARVREKISPIAKPDVILWTDDLPKTRSGKIMRRILRKMANNDFENFGDMSTLANPEVVEQIIGSLEAMS